MTRTIRIPSLEETKRGAEARSISEQLLHAVGVDPALVECVFGDLAEERAERSARHGRVIAAVWCAEQVVRSTPHLIVSAFRFGGPAARTRLAAALGIVAVAMSAGAAAFALRDGPPARLIAELANSENGVVINNVKPVQLPMRVLDKRGHRLESQPVHYSWASGAPISVSPTGEIKCGIAGDAIVRASSGSASADVPVRCRPVIDIERSNSVDLVAGDPPHSLPFTAVGLKREPVLELRGAVRVLDSSVATYDGTTIQARGVGETMALIEVGDRSVGMHVIVHELVSSFASLRPNQRNVAMSVRLGQGDTVHWALPAGVFWLKYLPRRANETPPTIIVEGKVNCAAGDGIHVYRMPLEEYGKYCVATEPASVLVAHGSNGITLAEGVLLLQRLTP